jgi:gamma-glutamyltranspeptidase/glutathione hydrolase
MDAACVTALTQISLNVGATVSYAGIMALVYYEAESGEVHALMAPFAIPLGEDSPQTIPKPGTPGGRTALVPGFMKGIESAHQRFGKLPFASLFGPAIFFAERGIVIEGPIEARIREKTEVLTRLPETRAVFTNDKGEFAAHGNFLQQRALATTLRRVAAEGAAYMYAGDWAQAFVSAVRAEGGKISPEDLARYDVVWSKPLRTTYNNREICTVAAPMIGGRWLLESLNLLELADPARHGHYTESAESCYWLIQCTRMPILLDYLPWLRLKLLMPYYVPDANRESQYHKQVVQAGHYPPKLLSELQALGQEIVELESFQAARYRGSWIGIALDPASAERRGAVDSNLNGAALAED